MAARQTRIFQIAKDLNISHTEILTFLKSKGVEVRAPAAAPYIADSTPPAAAPYAPASRHTCAPVSALRAKKIFPGHL